jgi:hypothetical protein
MELLVEPSEESGEKREEVFGTRPTRERMMGLEPTTFCMAKLATARACSLAFAETSCLQRLRGERANGSEPERTPSPAIAAIVMVATFNSRGSVVRRYLVSLHSG